MAGRREVPTIAVTCAWLTRAKRRYLASRRSNLGQAVFRPGTKVPASLDWLHEIKHDGYRLIVRAGKRAPVHRNGYDWSDRYPLVTEAALRNRNTRSGTTGKRSARRDGIGLRRLGHSREDDEVTLRFRLVWSGDGGTSKTPLSMRAANLSRSGRAFGT
jgi:bifunctional non-homologous end joining protein LigD